MKGEFSFSFSAFIKHWIPYKPKVLVNEGLVQADRQTSAGAGPLAPSSTSAPPPGTRTPEAPDPPSPGWPGGEPPLRSLPRGLAAELLKHLGDIPVDVFIMTHMASPLYEFGSLTR